MKKKELKDFKGKTIEELKKAATDIQVEIDKARMDLNLNKTKNTNLVKNKRKDIAQVLTILYEKEEK